MPALCARNLAMALSSAQHSNWPVHRPLHLDRWTAWLTKFGLAEKHSSFLHCIEHGFSYHSSISITENHIYPHMKSALLHPEAIEAVITKELSVGRYLGPFTLTELECFLGRPFIAHPLGAVEKANGKHRLVENLSHPQNGSFPSLNSLTDTSSLSLNWGSMADAARLVITAPPGSQAATVDWQEAFRNCGLKPSEWWLGVIHWKDLFHVDRALKFGGKASNHGFELSASALADLFMAIWTTLCIIYWVDDDHIRRTPINSTPPWKYEVDIEAIRTFAASLGAIFPPNKTVPFSFEVKYIGFLWLYRTKEVRIPENKRTEFLSLLTSSSESPTVNLPTLRTIVGKLSHFSMVVPLGRANMRGLWSLQTAMSEKAHSNAAWPWTTRQRQDLNWWLDTLSQPNVGMFLCTQTIPSSEFNLFCDASTSWGIGIVINEYWDAFKLHNGWNTSDVTPRDIGWAEFAAVELVVYFVLKHYNLHDTHLLIHTDNQGVVGAWSNRSSRNPASNDVLSRILSSLLARRCWLTLTYIRSADNPADRPSRGLPALNASRRSFTGFPPNLAGLMYRA
jgi:hypothetical protein